MNGGPIAGFHGLSSVGGLRGRFRRRIRSPEADNDRWLVGDEDPSNEAGDDE